MLKIGMRKIPYTKLLFWWVTTAWMSFVMTTASQAQVTSSVSLSGTNQATLYLVQTPTTTGPTLVI